MKFDLKENLDRDFYGNLFSNLQNTIDNAIFMIKEGNYDIYLVRSEFDEREHEKACKEADNTGNIFHSPAVQAFLVPSKDEAKPTQIIEEMKLKGLNGFMPKLGRLGTTPSVKKIGNIQNAPKNLFDKVKRKDFGNEYLIGRNFYHNPHIDQDNL